MIQNVLCKYTYIIFSDGGKLASSNCETAPTLPKKGQQKERLSQVKNKYNRK